MLRDYQQTAVTQIKKAFINHRKVLFQLSTGGGKTFTFCSIAKDYSKIGKVYILVNRNELVEQTYATLNSLGVATSKITSRQKNIDKYAKVYVCMVETFMNRKPYIPENSLAIIDECHIGTFDKVHELFTNSRILGTTATPVRLKRNKFYKCSICGSESLEEFECCNDTADKWTSPFSLSQIYDTIISGVEIKELIKRGSLIQDINFSFIPEGIENMKTDASGEYTEDSQNKIYGDEKQLELLNETIEKYCKGKKTMIFCSNSKINALVVEYLQNKGKDIKGYDSVNSKGVNRKELVKWFESGREVILSNVNVFTTGFDVTDVEVIIMFRATKSLSLWLQIVGRGARPTQKIYKDDFTVIDFGNNIDEHGKWSDDRDWEMLFYKGLGKKKGKVKDVSNFWECKQCGFFNPQGEAICDGCGHEKQQYKKEKTGQNGKIELVDNLPLPNAKKIHDWTVNNNQDQFFAFKVLQNQIISQFKFHNVTKEHYIRNRQKWFVRVLELIKPTYFVVLGSKEINKSGAKRTLDQLHKTTIKKIEKLWNI